MLQMTCAAIGRESPKRSASSENSPSSKKGKYENKEDDTSEVSERKTPNHIIKESPKKVSEESRVNDSSRNDVIKNSLKVPAKQQRITSPGIPYSGSVSRRSPKNPHPIPSSTGSSPHGLNLTSVESQSAAVAAASKTSNARVAAALLNTQASGMAMNSLLNPSIAANSLLQTAELDRYLRSLYGTSPSALSHPSLYPSLLNHGVNNPYLSPYLTPGWGASSLTPGLAASYAANPLLAGAGLTGSLASAGVGSFGLGSTPIAGNASVTETLSERLGVETGKHNCNWGACGKKFPSADLLSHHVKTEHLERNSTTNQDAGSTQSSANTLLSSPTQNPASAALTALKSSASVGQGHVGATVPRFSPYTVSGYPRDLLASRFVYS